MIYHFLKYHAITNTNDARSGVQVQGTQFRCSWADNLSYFKRVSKAARSSYLNPIKGVSHNKLSMNNPHVAFVQSYQPIIVEITIFCKK